MSGATTLADPPIPTPGPGRRMVWGYAGFWWRVLAFLVDFAVLALLDAVLRAATGLPRFGFSFDNQPQIGGDASVSSVAYTATFAAAGPHWHTHGGAMELISLAVAIAYFVLLESSRWQATLGKRVCGMRVTDLSGRRIGIGRALGRYLGKFVSWLLCGIGFLMVGWTRRKQGLHDMMAGTLVMRRHEAEPVFTFNEPAA